MQDEVKNIITSSFKLCKSKVTLAATLYGDLQLESLDFLELICAIEDHFNIELSEHEIESIRTVQDLVNCVRNHIEPQPALA